VATDKRDRRHLAWVPSVVGGYSGAVSGRRTMLTWLKNRVRDDRIAAERRGVQLVYDVFGPYVEDITPAMEEPRTAA
jgi:hypothetical protein